MEELTVIKYIDGSRIAQYGYTIPIDKGMAQYTHTMISQIELEELQNATYENVQKILEQYI